MHGYNGGGYGTYGTYGYAGSSSYYGETAQLQSNKRQQALRYSYETLGNLLSSAENFAGLPNEKYGKYNVTTSNKYEDMKSEFAWELHCFQLAIKKFQKKFQCPYEFPRDLPKEIIIKDIHRYIKRISNQKDKILYYSMINIINGEKININFDKLFEELDKNSNSKIDPSKLRKIIGPLNEILDQNLEEADEGNMKFELANDKNKRDKLRGISSENLKIIRVKQGTEGILNQTNNIFSFTPNNSTATRQVRIDEPIFDNFNSLYPDIYTVNKNQGKIYIIKAIKENSYKSIYFNNMDKEYNQELFTKIECLKNNKYIYGNIKQGYEIIPVLLEEEK